MGWWILWSVLTIITILVLIISEKKEWENGSFVCVITLTVLFFALIIISALSVECRNEETNFLEAKYIFENNLDSGYGILEKSPKEYNAWLMQAKYNKEKEGTWNLYSKKVLDLELIKIDEGE